MDWSLIIKIIVIAGVVGWLYGMYIHSNSLKLENSKLEQNQQFLTDSLSKAADQVVTLAAKIADLESKGPTIVTKYITRPIAVHDSGKVSEDSSNHLLSFSGKRYIASYAGDVNTLTKQWHLNISFDDIEATGELFQDADKLWKVRMTSKTPGVNVIGYTTIDTRMFKQIEGYSNSTPDTFGAGLLWNAGLFTPGISLKIDRYMGSAYYGGDRNSLYLGLTYYIW